MCGSTLGDNFLRCVTAAAVPSGRFAIPKRISVATGETNARRFPSSGSRFPCIGDGFAVLIIGCGTSFLADTRAVAGGVPSSAGQCHRSIDPRGSRPGLGARPDADGSWSDGRGTSLRLMSRGCRPWRLLAVRGGLNGASRTSRRRSQHQSVRSRSTALPLGAHRHSPAMPEPCAAAAG